MYHSDEVRLKKPPYPSQSNQGDVSHYEDAETGLEEQTGPNAFLSARYNSTNTINQTDEHSHSTVFTMANKQSQPSMTTMNANMRDSFEINSEKNFLLSNDEPLGIQVSHNQSSHKFKILQQNMKEELYNSTSKSSSKRNRRFITSRLSSLGPAKRNLSTSFNVDSPGGSRIDSSQINSSMINDESNISQAEAEQSNSSNNSSTGYRYHDHNIFLEIQKRSSTPNPDENKDPSAIQTTNLNYENIDFGDLNPYQYLKKHNLPSEELPSISRVYFERQKEENRKTVLRKASSGTLALKRELTHFKKADNVRQPRRKNTFQPAKTASHDPLSSPILSDDIPQQPHITTSNTKREPLRPHNINVSHSLQDNKRPKFSHRASAEVHDPFYSQKNTPLATEAKPTKRVEILEPMRSTVEVVPLKSEGHQAAKSSYDGKRPLTYSAPSIIVNGTAYEKVELLGKGGSGKVYKVKAADNKVYALKRVSFDEFDETGIEGFKGEIELLRKLEHEQRVVKLIDYQMGHGVLFLLMECGEHDLSQVLSHRMKAPFEMEFVRYHFKEMMKCVKVVHDADIVHSDLKPANFVFVKGMLKIIDFGIANAVPDHTVNIYRDNQIGTPNYMAPETLVAMNFTRNDGEQTKWKVGKPSDVWSCGCILYQMVYGKPPYGSFQGNNRLYAIMNSEVKIPYPEKDSFGTVIPRTVIDTIKSCLERNPISRVTVDQLLKGGLVNPVTVTKFFIHDLIKNAVNYGCEQKHVNNDRIEELSEDVWNKLADFRL